MSFIEWMAAVGGLLLTMSLISGWVRRLPLSSYMIYLLVGIAVGPTVAGVVRVDMMADAYWLERLTDMTLIVSLFIGGLKLRVPLGHQAWQSAVRLASIAMVLGIGGAAAFAHFVLGMEWPLALMLGAILAPTDPVLSSQVSVDDASDRDALRVPLSGEAGFNDGAALPFLMLGLIALKGNLSWSSAIHWSLLNLLWAIAGGLLIGYGMGRASGRLAVSLQARTHARVATDLLILALMALSYALAEAMHALGFLAAFAAGLGLRGAEMATVRRHPHPDQEEEAEGPVRDHPPAETLYPRNEGKQQRGEPASHVGEMMFHALSLGDTLERLLATLLLLLLGVLLAGSWSLRGLMVAGVLFLVIRPLSVWISTAFLKLPWQRRAMMGWLGIRGIGSLNYLAYALLHGLAGHPQARGIVNMVVTVIAISVMIHGASAQPLLAWRRRTINRLKKNDAADDHLGTLRIHDGEGGT